MKVGEVIDRLNKKESLAVIAKQIGITPYTLSKKLRLLGYEYDREKKKRVFVGAGEELREWEILDISPNHLLKETPNYQELIYEELQKIRLLLDREREKTLPAHTGRRLRRTFSICENVLKQLDETAKKTGWQKSRIMETALKEWLEKFS